MAWIFNKQNPRESCRKLTQLNIINENQSLTLIHSFQSLLLSICHWAKQRFRVGAFLEFCFCSPRTVYFSRTNPSFLSARFITNIYNEFLPGIFMLNLTSWFSTNFDNFRLKKSEDTWKLSGRKWSQWQQSLLILRAKISRKTSSKIPTFLLTLTFTPKKGAELFAKRPSNSTVMPWENFSPPYPFTSTHAMTEVKCRVEDIQKNF